MPYNEKAFRDTSRNSYVVSGGLILSAIIAWKRDELSLLDGLIVSMVCSCVLSLLQAHIDFGVLNIAHDDYDGLCNRQCSLRKSL